MLVISYGADAVKSTSDALGASDIGSYLKRGGSAAIKPNLVVPRPASEGATTHPEVVGAVIRFLKDFGIKEIKIIESSGAGYSTKRAFAACGYEALSKKYGVRLIDLTEDGRVTRTYGGNRYEICREALETDFLINVPVLKAHCQTRLTCCMKNLKGCIPDAEKHRYHTLGIHRPVAELNMLIKTGYCVVDGICGDLSFEEGGEPVEAHRIIAGRDPVEVDSYCAELIGYNPDEIGYLSRGKAIGAGKYFSDDTEVIELNREDRPKPAAKKERLAGRYADMIEEDSACSVCYSALVYALRKAGAGGLKDKLYIGQGYSGKTGDGIGIGDCVRGFTRCAAGCPPKATDILKVLNFR